jgi:hypothetical protein
MIKNQHFRHSIAKRKRLENSHISVISDINFSLHRFLSYLLLMFVGILCQCNIAYAQMGKAIDLSGVADYIQAPASTYFNGDFTVEGWVYPRDNGYSYYRFFDFGNGTAGNNVGFHFGPAGGTNWFMYSGSSRTDVLSSTNVPYNQWTHIAITLEGTTGKVYINGQLSGTNTAMLPPLNVSRANCYIGKSNWAGEPNTKGKFDEFRIWNVARTQEQIQDNMNRTLVGTETGLQLYYNMETIAANGQSQTVTDLATGNGAQNGTTIGTASSPVMTSLDANATWANSLDFDGSNDFVSFANTGITTASGTVEFWMNLDAIGADQSCFDLSGNEAFVVLPWSNGTIYFRAGGVQFNVPIPAAGKWRHIAMTWTGNGTAFRGYIDGVQVGTATQGATGIVGTLAYIGRIHNGAYAYNGKISDFRIWNTARTAAEIQNNRYSMVAANSPGLIRYYKLNQGTANGTNTSVTTALDASVNAVNATLTNFALTGTTSNWVAKAPMVTTPTKSGITGTTAALGATYPNLVTELEEKGVIFNTTGNPSLTNGRKAVSAGNTTGAYSAAATNLKGGTKYYYRGYAYTSNDIAYTSTIDSFTTTYSNLGNALAFDASLSNHFYIGSGLGNNAANPILNTLTNALTLEVWIKPRDYSTQRFLNRQDQNGYCWVLQIINGELQFHTNSTTSGGKMIAIPQLSIPLNQWTHVAGVYNGTQMVLYINGVAVGTVAQSGALHTSSAFAGVGNAGNVGGYYNGAMDELRIWNVARTQAQIQANMDAPISPTSTGLICYFPFDQGVANAPNPSVTIPVEAVSNLPVVYGGIFTFNGSTSNWVAHTDVSFASTSSNNALNFDGVNDCINLGVSSGALNSFNTGISLEAWINPTTYNGNGATIVMKQDANYWTWGLKMESIGMTFYLRTGTGYSSITTPLSATPLNQWSHVVGTYDGSQMRLYVNGVLVASTSKTGVIDNTAVLSSIGSTGLGWQYFNGSIDEVRIWNVARTQAEILAAMNTTIAANTTGLVAYYPMNQGVANGFNSSINIANDVTSTALNGTLLNFNLNGHTSNWVNAYMPSSNNNALDFDGTNDHVQVPAGNYFNGGNFTAEGWVYMRSYNSWSRFFDFGNGQGNNNVVFTLSTGGSGQPELAIFNGTSSSYVTSNTAIPSNQWAHVACTLNGTTGTIYINGRVVATGTILIPSNINLSNCYIGRSNWAADAYFNGEMDEFRLWNVARTQAQIQMNATVSIPAGTPGLVLYYPFNQGVASGNNTAITTSTSVGSSPAIATLNNFALTGNTSNFVYGNSLLNSAPDGRPTISNVQAAQATFTSVSGASNGASIQEQGFLYNAGTTVPTMTSGTKIVSSSTATGSFSGTATGLAENQLYTVRSYITTASGTALSATNTFTTSLCRIYPTDMTITVAPTNAAVTWTTNTTGATAYSWKVVNSGAGANGTAVSSGTTTNTSLTITNLPPNKNYDFYLLITGGCTTTTWSDARPFSTKLDWKNALHLDGTNDYADAGNVAAVNNLTSNATFEAWVRPANVSGTQVILNKTASGNGITFSLVNGVPTASLSTSTLGTVAGTAALTANQWAHLAAVYNGTAFVLYVNGRQVGTTNLTGNIAANAGSVFIGKGATTNHFSGMIDEVKVWNVARTQSQIWASMNSGVLANTNGLILDYAFNEGIANAINTGLTTAIDSSASAANATLNGFSLANNTSNWVARAPYNIVPTVPISSITFAGATVNGNVNMAGTGTIVERGFIWNSGTTAPILGIGTKTSAAGTTLGAFSTALTGLALGQTYTFASYTFSSDGYNVSSPTTFVMDLCGSAPALNTIVASNITATSATFSWATVAPSYDWILSQSGFGTTNPVLSGSSATGTVNLTGLEIGVNYDFFLRGNCTTTQSPWQTPVTFQTLAVPTFTTNATLNDAYVDLNWTLHPLPCLINNGTPYTQGIYVKVTDLADGKVLKQEPITNLTPFIGVQQPTFNYVASDSVQGYICTVNNTNNWQNYNSSTWTIETWVKGNNSSNNAEIFRANLVNNIAIKISGTVISVQKNAVTTNFSTPFPLGKWKHLTFSYDGGSVSLYIDGVKKEQKAISNLVFGGGAATYSVANNLVNVQMGEIRYWNRVRSDLEISANRWATSFNGLAQNNLLLHLRWNANNAAPVDLATTYDGQNNTVVYSGIGTLQTLPYITTPDYTPIVGTFRHYVGPTKSKNYKLEVFQIGTGAAIATCTNLTTTGSTIAFQQPINGSATINLLDRVRLQWTNKSKLSETFKIFRNNTLRSVIAGSEKLDSVFTWEDVYSADDSLSIVNGTSYSYCIETYCNNLGTGYAPQLCKTGNTFNLNFTASDNSPTNKVNLSWANVSSYGYNIQIKREGTLIATLPASAITYADANPIYGKTAKYEMILVNASTSEVIVSKSDNGSVPARGSISGRVVTLENNYALKNVRIKLHSLVDTLVNLTTYTDYLGNYTFNGLYYELAGQFEVSADYGNHVFLEPLKTITLNDAKFAATNVDFLDSTGLTLNPMPLAVSSFVGIPVTTQDKINFAWNANLSAGDTILYDIYREATRIATLTSLSNALSYTDLGGEPNVSYKYKLNAYKVTGGMITAIELADTLLFPPVCMTTAFSVIPNTTLGVVNMTWSHTSSNYDGFRIYRNGKKIAEIPVGTFSYTDADAKPGTAATYVLKAKRFLNNITFESAGQTASNVNIPALPAVTGVTATANTTRNSILVSWTIPAALIATYNYDGFRVYRRLSSASSTTDVYIGQLPKAINPPFEDKTAIPNTAYTYTVKSYLRLSDNSIGESNGASANATCPVVSAPAGLTASTTLVGEVALAWTSLSTTLRNLDGIIVLRGTDTLAVLPYNANTYRAFTNNPVSASYSVRVFRNVAGVRRFSAAISASGKAATASTTIEYATNVSVPQNLANHVRLSWEYPSYVLSTFNIYRDNVLLTTLPTESRVYIDNAAVAGTTHFYQIEAVNGANISQRAGAQGRLRSIRELNGMVYSNTDKYGVPNVDVYVSGTGFTGHAKTDSSGFYVFSGLPETAGTAMTVFVDGYGANHTSTFVPSSQTFSIAAGANVYTRNFGSSYTPAITDTIAPTRPMNIIATPNPSRRRVSVTWTTSNTYYDGFEVYRANVLLADVKKGENLIAYDTTGYPGISYTYQIRSYQYSNELSSNKYSSFYQTTGTYPVLEAPIYVTATPNLAINTLKLTWSHNWDNHTRYEISRNDSLLTNVNVKSLLEYVDNTGIPGQQYVYSIKAAMVVGNQTHYSDATTVTIQYPTIAEAGNLTATTPSSSTSYTTPCTTNISQERNLVELNWTYNASALLKGFRVYREQTLLANLPKDSLHYTDYDGVPGTLQSYTVKSILEREGDNYYSQGVTASKIYPTLATPKNVTHKDTLGLKQMRWEYPDGGASGFYILRGTTVIDTVLADSMRQKYFVYKDKSGVSGTSYDYTIKAYSRRNDITYWANDFTCLTGLTYPKPLTPTNVAATDGTYLSYVKVSWNYPQGADVSGFAILRDGVQIATVAGGIKNYFDLSASVAAAYSIRAYKTGTFQGNTYTNNSDLSTVDNGFPGQTASVLNAIDFTNITGSGYGRSVAMGNNRLAVGGALGTVSSGRVQLFNYATNTWNTGTQLTGANTSFGYAIDAAGDELIIGQPNNGQYGVYNMLSGSYSQALTNVTGANWWNGLSGAASSVGISSTSKVLGFPQEDASTGEVAWVKNGPSPFSGRFENSGYGASLVGYSVAINNSYTVVGVPGFGTVASANWNKAFIVAADYTTTSTPNAGGSGVALFPQPTGLTNNARFGAAVNISRNGTDRIIVGAPGQLNKGAVYIAELTNSNWISTAALSNPSGANNDLFGNAVAIEGDIAAVSAPGRNGGKGEVYLYQRNLASNTWSLAQAFANPTTTADSMGVSLELSGNFLFIGAPKANAGKGRVYWIDLGTISAPTVTATQGTLNGQTRIDWTPSGSSTTIAGFKVYRDGSLIQTANTSDRYFYDANGVAGKHYIYEVCAYTNTGENARKATEGWSKADGYLEGKVATLIGSGGVGGVSIKAVTAIDGNDYIYTTITDANGNYAIPDVYYGNSIANFSLTANYGDHLFLTNPIYTTLSPQQKNRSYLIFTDKTAYSISGKVGRRDAGCYLDSIHVYGEYIMADSTTEMFVQDAYTTPDGSYSLNINPYKSDIIGLKLYIDSTKILVNSNGADTLHYRFKPSRSMEFTSLINFPQSTILNFEDTLTYPVRLEVLTACRNNVTGGNFRIRVRSKDDCFDKIFVTDLSGKVNANLPPLNFTMNVEGVVNNTAANQLVIDYLRYRPQVLDIYSKYKGELYHQDSTFWDSLTNQAFIYHRPPSISVLSGFDRYLCDNPNNPAIIKQGTEYSLTFQVSETFNNTPCVSKTGYLVLRNAAAESNEDTVYIDIQNGSVEPYFFVAGNPNLVSPYRHTLTIEYRTDIGELIATKTMAIIVEGNAMLPGADIVVDAGNGNGSVDIPTLILRDPMGDGSSSSIEKGSTITKSFSLSSDFVASLGYYHEAKIAGPAGFKTTLSLKGGGGAGGGKAWELSATTTETISTSDASWHVGPEHDVIVGAGMALQYGLVQEIKVNGCNDIVKTQKLGFSPHSVKTTWYYTIAQIKALILEYENKIEQIEAGTLVIQENGKSLSKADAKARLSSYKGNWEKILGYHAKETLPWYNLCKYDNKKLIIPDTIKLRNGGKILRQKYPLYKSAIEKWVNEFCPLVGSYSGKEFLPKDNIVWDKQLVDAYNTSMTAIRNLQETYLDLDIQELPNEWTYHTGALSEPEKFIDEAYVNLHDLEAQNITFGSGVIINKSFESAASSTSTLSGSAFLNFDLFWGFAVTVGTAIGLGSEVKLIENDAYYGPTFGVSWNFSTEQSTALANTNNISYTLSDDDDIDQFSVTVIQGIDPHQTPYFSLLGGRSSCPQEAGTLYRDNPSIAVWDPVTESTSKEGTINFVEPNEAAVMYMQVSNQNPFGESRNVSITLNPLTNLDGAKITIAGTPLVAGQKVILSLPPDEPVIVPVSIERGLWAYDYEGLTFDVKPACGNVWDDMGDNSMIGNSPYNTSVTLNVHFKNECSPITIAEPDGYWTILKQNVNDPNSREVLPIRLMDYDPKNANLLDVHLEYRRKGNGLTWHQIPSSELSPATLQTWNEENFLASQVPYYMYSWDITGDYQTYPDGEYEVRAVAECGLGGRVYSNTIKGAIERKTNLYGLPQPSDKVWTVGDEISVAFNLDIDCAGIADSNFVVQKYGDPTTTLPGTVACANNKLIFSPDLSLTSYFDGDTLEMIVGGVRTFNGNVLDTVRWTFLVISRDLYVTKDSLSVELTQGQTADLATTLVNNMRTGQALNYHIQNLTSATSWLSCADSTGTVVFNSPKDLSFHINSKEMPIGTTTLNLDIFANGRLYENAIKISVKVLPKGPDWDFDPSAYSQDMTLVTNYNFNNTNVKSVDTTDLISVWIDNKLRGVANINKFTTTLYSAVISVYGNPSDFGKALKFRVWDASAGVEYDARPDANATISFAPDKIEGSVSSPRLLDVFTASDKVRYIPLNQGWTMFSVNTNRWNAPLNAAIASLRHPHDGDVIKTANKSAEYVSTSNSWVSDKWIRFYECSSRVSNLFASG